MSLSDLLVVLMLMHKAIKYLEGYTRQYLYKAKLARELQGMSGHPSEHGYKDIVSNKLFPKFSIITKYITNAKSIFRSNLALVRVKKVKHNPSRLNTEVFVSISSDF